VEVEDEGEHEDEEEEEEFNPHSSEEPSSFSGRASKLAFEPQPAHHQLLPVRIPPPVPRGHVIYRLASLRLLACDCDAAKQERVNSCIPRDA